MRVDETLAAATSALAGAAGLDDPAREARYLLARLLGRPEAWLLAHPEAPLGPAYVTTLADWTARRRAGAPAHYLVGSCPFWGREMAVTPAVLIPRPETELIVERALRLSLPASPRLLDVGTGSGALAVTLALEVGQAAVVASDASLAALALARRNAAAHGARLLLACGDLATHLRGPFDLVVANLPYIPDREMAALPATVREHEPHEALAGGTDGADLLRGLVADLPRLLAPAGAALLEVGPGHATLLERDVAAARLCIAERLPDAGGVERVIALRDTASRS